jgi:hypothetical protein
MLAHANYYINTLAPGDFDDYEAEFRDTLREALTRDGVGFHAQHTDQQHRGG